MFPFGLYTLLWFYSNVFPIYWNQRIYQSSGKKFTFVLSNVPGYIKPVTYFDGCPVKRFTCLCSGSGNIATGINIVSLDKRATMAITSDVTQIEDIDGFISKMLTTFKDLDIMYKSDEEGSD